MLQLNIFRFGAVFTAASALAACGGGEDGGNVDLSVDPTDVAVSSVLATGSDSLTAAETFPLSYTLASPGDTQATLQSGIGSIEVVDTDTIRVVLEAGDSPFDLTATVADGTTFSGTTNDGDPITLELNEGSGTLLAFISVDPNLSDGVGFAGIYGFETPTGSLPSGTIVYDSAGLAEAFIVTGGDDEPLILTQETATNPALTVEFGTGGVSGTLFDGTALVDFDLDENFTDVLNVRADIANGNINNGDISGQVALFIDVDMDGDTNNNVDLNPIVATSEVDAQVYGSAGNVVGGTFQATGSADVNGEFLDTAVGGTFFTVD